jgi:hypothetical protein
MKAFRDPVDEWLKATVGADANPMITMLGKLTDLQYDFARAYVLCGNPKKAGERVKLPRDVNPNLLIHLPKIAACINLLTAKREETLGKKTSAEIMERIMSTPMLDEDMFATPSEGVVLEREELIGKPQEVTQALTNLDDNALAENLLNASSDNGIMQLPKVKVPNATSFGPAWIIERCVTVAERCLQIEPVFDKKGRPIGQFTFNAPASLKALEMLGKTMALFRDKVEISGELSSFKTGELDGRIQELITAHPELAKVIDGEILKKETTH